LPAFALAACRPRSSQLAAFILQPIGRMKSLSALPHVLETDHFCMHNITRISPLVAGGAIRQTCVQPMAPILFSVPLALQAQVPRCTTLCSREHMLTTVSVALADKWHESKVLVVNPLSAKPAKRHVSTTDILVPRAPRSIR